MGFIPDRGVSNKKENPDTAVIAENNDRKKANRDKNRSLTSQKEKTSKKKIVSYYLETDLIDKMKSMADKNDMYYSALVTSALKSWIANHN